MKLKAAETKYFSYFINEQLAKHQSKLHLGMYWVAAAVSMKGLFEVMESSPWKMSVPQIQDRENLNLLFG